MKINSELIWTGFSQIVQFVGGIVVFKLMTTLLTKNDYGTYSIFIAISAFVVAMPFSAIMQGVVKYIPEMVDLQEKNRLLRVFFTFFSIVLLIYVALGFLLIESYSSLEDYSIYLVVFVIFDVLKTSIYTSYNGLRQRKTYATLISIEYLSRMILLILVYYFFGMKFQYSVCAFILPSIFVVVFSMFKDFRITMSFNSDDFDIFKKIIVFSSPLIIWALFGWARDMGIRAYIEALLTREELAAYTAISSLAIILPTVVGSFVTMYVLPIIYEKEIHKPGSAREYVKKLLKYGFFIIILSGILMDIISVYLVNTLASSNYIDNARYLSLLFVGQSLFTISMMMTVEVYCYNQTKLLIIPNVMSGISSMALGYYLISCYGLSGAFFAGFLSYISYFIFTFIVCYKFKPVEM